MAFGNDPLEVDPVAPGRGRAARTVIGAGVGGVSAGSIAAVTLAAQAVLEAYLPVLLTRLEADQVAIVAAGAVTGAGMVLGALWGLLAPAVRRALGTAALLLLVLLLPGCVLDAAARWGPPDQRAILVHASVLRRGCYALAVGDLSIDAEDRAASRELAAASVVGGAAVAGAAGAGVAAAGAALSEALGGPPGEAPCP
jgi:hypothetical protein